MQLWLQLFKLSSLSNSTPSFSLFQFPCFICRVEIFLITNFSTLICACLYHYASFSRGHQHPTSWHLLFLSTHYSVNRFWYQYWDQHSYNLRFSYGYMFMSIINKENIKLLAKLERTSTKRTLHARSIQLYFCIQVVSIWFVAYVSVVQNHTGRQFGKINHFWSLW